MRKRSQPSQQAHNDGAAIPVGIGKDDNGQDYGRLRMSVMALAATRPRGRRPVRLLIFSEWFSRGVSGVISIGGSGVILLDPAGF